MVLGAGLSNSYPAVSILLTLHFENGLGACISKARCFSLRQIGLEDWPRSCSRTRHGGLVKIHLLALIIFLSATALSFASFAEEEESLSAVTEEQIEELYQAQDEAEQGRQMASLDVQNDSSIQSGEFNIRLTAHTEYQQALAPVLTDSEKQADEQVIRSECFQRVIENSPEDVVLFVDSVQEKFATCKSLSGDETQLGICNQSVIDHTNSSETGKAIEKEVQACVQESLAN